MINQNICENNDILIYLLRYVAENKVQNFYYMIPV